MSFLQSNSLARHLVQSHTHMKCTGRSCVFTMILCFSGCLHSSKTLVHKEIGRRILHTANPVCDYEVGKCAERLVLGTSTQRTRRSTHQKRIYKLCSISIFSRILKILFLSCEKFHTQHSPYLTAQPFLLADIHPRHKPDDDLLE